MITQALSFVRKSRALHLAFVLCLLFAGYTDLGHEHAGSIADMQCYVCHFSPDLGLSAGGSVPQPLEARNGFWPNEDVLASMASWIRGYDSRGPPALS